MTPGTIGHQVEEVLAGLDVAVQRCGAGAKLGGHPPHGDRVQALGVGDSQRGLGDLGPAPLRGRPAADLSGRIQMLAAGASADVMFLYLPFAIAVLNL